tara:strand:- start:143 stop:1270 length:1128 start_codon:yes stop_codon:yes gene_type:complete
MQEGHNNIALGHHALGDSNNVGSDRNIAIGNYSGDGMGNAFANLDNIFIGYAAGGGTWDTSASSYNVAIGNYSMDAAMDGAAQNVSIGYQAGTAITHGDSNVLTGYQCGDAITDGYQNVGVGAAVAFANEATAVNQIVIGYGATGTANNEAVIGNASIDKVYMAQDATAAVHAGKFQVGSPAETPALGIQSDVNDIVQHMDNGATSGNVFIAKWKFTGKSPDDNTSYFVKMEDAGADKVQIWSDGDINNADNAYGSISDKRIKQGIRDANSQWDDIKAVKVRNFKKNEDVDQYGDNAWEQIGVVAQELEASGMDKLVKEHPASENEARTGDGSFKEGDMIKSVSYSVLYMKAIKALQEAMTKIETLESKVAALEG